MKRFLVAGVGIFLASALGYVAWSAWRDPVAALPPPDLTPALAGSSIEPRGGRRLEHVRLDARGLGQISIVVSLPDPLPNRKLPIVVVLGGLATGERSVRHIPVIGENVVIGYEWPIPARLPRGLALLRHVPTLHDRVLSVPGQVATVIRWAQDQEWSDPSRVSLLGFSLGALALPAAQRLAAQHGISIGWTVLAYGGAPIGALVEAQPRVRERWFASALGHLVDLVLRPVEPSAHLPHLTGRFLVLEGRDDPLVPAHVAAHLRELTPQPKRVIAFDGGHMGIGPAQELLLNIIIAESRAWLIREGAVNPVPAQASGEIERHAASPGPIAAFGPGSRCPVVEAGGYLRSSGRGSIAIFREPVEAGAALRAHSSRPTAECSSTTQTPSMSRAGEAV